MTDKPEKIDQIDLSILASLRSDSKTQLNKLANKLHIHPNTILQRLRKLEKSGIIKKYIADIDFSKTGYDLQIVIMLKLKSGRAGDVNQLKDLLHIKEIEAVYAISGLWDVLALARVRNRNHFLTLIHKLATLPYITKTNSSIVLFEYKSPGDFNPYEHELPL